MAKFSTDKNLYLDDYQKIILGTDDDSSLWFDGLVRSLYYVFA